jgi:hypothetical protein
VYQGTDQSEDIQEAIWRTSSVDVDYQSLWCMVLGRVETYPNAWSKMDVDAFAAKFFANRHTAAAHQRLIESTTNSNTWGKRRVMISVPNAERSVLKTVVLLGLEW